MFSVSLLHADAISPRRATIGSAGFDVAAYEDAIVPARGRALVRTGVSFLFPPERYVQLKSRSGLASKHAIDVGAGVIDSDYYPGEVRVLLINHSDKDYVVKRGDWIAQGIPLELADHATQWPDVYHNNELVQPSVAGDAGATPLRSGGFGSTGK